MASGEEDALLDSTGLMDDEEDEITKKSVAKWNSGKWCQQSTGKSKIVQFVFEEFEIGEEQELPVCSIEWDLGDLNLTFPVGEKEKVKLFEIDPEAEKITIVTNVFTYNGSVEQLLHLKNLETKKNIDNITFPKLFNFIKKYQLHQEEENQQFTPLKSTKKETKGHKRRGKNEKDKINSKKSRIATVNEPSVSQIESDVLVNLNHRISNEELPKFNTKILSLNVLEPDFTFRKVSDANVNFFADLMRKGHFNTSGNPIIVQKIKNSEKYLILNGNGRFCAIEKYNTKADKQILTVDCHVYEDLNFDQMVLIRNGGQSPESELTILQMAKVVSKIVFNHQLSLPSTAKTQLKEFEKLMQTYFVNRYHPICTELIRLPPQIFNAIFEISCDTVLIEHLSLTSTFWNTFVTAVKNNQKQALEHLGSLKSIGEMKEVQKKLNKVEIDLLAYLSRRATHNFETEEEAIKELTGGKKIDKDIFVTALHKININHNRNRGGPEKNVWKTVATKLQKFFDNGLTFSNAKYIEDIDEVSLSKQNFIVTENPKKSLTKLLEKYHKNFVLLMFSFGWEEAPQFTNISPTATFDILIEGLITIDKPIDFLPRNTIKASLFIPDAPEEDAKGKLKFLTEMAMEKQCRLASTIVLNESHELAKFATDFQSALISCSSTKITSHFLSNLQHFRNLNVIGDDRHKDLVAAISQSNDANRMDETLDLETSIEVNDNLKSD